MVCVRVGPGPPDCAVFNLPQARHSRRHRHRRDTSGTSPGRRYRGRQQAAWPAPHLDGVNWKKLVHEQTLPPIQPAPLNPPTRLHLPRLRAPQTTGLPRGAWEKSSLLEGRLQHSALCLVGGQRLDLTRSGPASRVCWQERLVSPVMDRRATDGKGSAFYCEYSERTILFYSRPVVQCRDRE